MINGFWFLLTLPVYLAVTYNLSNQAKSVALWVYWWLAACFCAINTWSYYKAWKTLSPPGYPTLPANQEAFEHTLWANIALTLLILIAPILGFGISLVRSQKHL